MQNNIDVYGNQNLAGILKTLANSLKEVSKFICRWCSKYITAKHVVNKNVK